MRIEGNDDQVAGFKNFVEDQVHEGMQISSIIFEEYTGHVYTIEAFLALLHRRTSGQDGTGNIDQQEKLNSNSNDVIIELRLSTMSGNTFGTIFRITTWGESHGRAVGVVVDGCPAGLALAAEDIQKELDRRRPGQSRASTQRKEEDRAEILSGIFEGRTTGTPISMTRLEQGRGFVRLRSLAG